MKTMRDQAGFTLLEVLVAGLIAALALAVLFRTGIESVSATRDAAAYERALSLAQSHLAAASAMPVPGEAGGRDGGFAWATQVTAVATTAAATDLVHWVQHPGEQPATLFRIETTVSWPKARQIRLRTERIGFGASPP